ncbi:MAG: recombination mediator RecR [Bacteroidota bacterium]
MSYSSRLLEEAVEALSGLPGIGKKTALRLALHLIKSDQSIVKQDFLAPLARLVTDIRFCEECFNLSDDPKCTICTDRGHRADTICVVESVRDVMAIEETNQYSGLYHVLGGVISPLDGVTASDLTITELVQRVQEKQIKEVIMAISPTIEGETTIYYISKKLSQNDVRISMLARGISFGGELEYADEMTLGRSIATRTLYTADEL